jgi:serine/threonine protein kinase
MALAPKTVFGQYRIGRELGHGGMGEVYQATHLSLEREVALKMLRRNVIDVYCGSLIQEARAASALDHPNIVKVYDVAEVDGIAYIAMEYIEGQTLRQVLSRHALRTKEVLEYAGQIARALAAAHAVGILHRDIKPGNIMITRKRVIKVVDFGLAKRFDPPESRSDETESTQGLETGAPRISQSHPVGTLSYMSPEQVLSLRVDVRSDIFSFGVVLYEMLTRVQPFAAPTDSGLIANILHMNPSPISEIVSDVPEEVDELVQFCLRKDPDDRARSMHDIAHMIEVATRAMERRDVGSGTGGISRRRLTAVSAALLTLITLGIAIVFVTSPGEHIAPRDTLRRMTWDDSLAESPALSDDGKLLAFASDRATGKDLDIFIRHTSGGEPIRLTNDPADDTDPSFSPDGSLIAFRSERQGGGVYVMPSFGGQERLVVSRGNNPRFSPDGKWIAYWIGEAANTYPSARAYVVPTTGGTSTQLQPSFADARYPIWTSDGTHILFQGVDVWKPDAVPNSDWWVSPVGEVKNGDRAVKTGAWDAIKRSGLPTVYPAGGWYRDRVIFSARDDAARYLVALPISTRTWRAQEPIERLTFGTGIEGYPYPSASGSIAFTSYKIEMNIWARSLDDSGHVKDKEARKLTAGEAYHTSASMDVGGTRLVFLLGRRPTINVWIREMATGREAAVTIDATDKCSAAISADGSQVAWSVCGPGPEPIFVARINPDLSVPAPEKICEDCGRVVDWSREGDSILYVDHSNPVRLGMLALSSGTRKFISSARYNLDKARYSPQGNWIAVTAATGLSDRAQIFAIAVQDGKPAPESAWVPITNGSYWDDNPVWTERGDAVLFYSRRDGFGCIWRQAVDLTTKRPKGAPTEVMEFHGGRLSIKQLTGSLPSLLLIKDQLLFNALQRTGSIWVLEDWARAGAGS